MRETLPRGYDKEALERRKQVLVEDFGVPFSQQEPDDPEKFQGLAENQVGYLNLPISVAGPLQISGDYANGRYYVPICALEGTLCLSMTRGMLITSKAGGIKTNYLGQQLQRCPVFYFDDIAKAIALKDWINKRTEKLREVAESTTRFGKLLTIDTVIAHTYLYVYCSYTTGDASGQNMVTIATQKMCDYIVAQSGIAGKFLIESNMSGDKNALKNDIRFGRGHKAIASTIMRPEHFNYLFGTRDIYETAKMLNVLSLGSSLANMVGVNGHVANALAALYLALGQDVASIVENVNCYTCHSIESDGKSALFSLTVPALTIGTVGGATRLAQQSANLRMLGCDGEHSARKLSEIIAASMLCLELSLVSSIVRGDFAAAHKNFRYQTGDK